MPLDLSFDLPMDEALSFWKDKLKLSPGEFSKLSVEAKTRAFAISGIARGDELDTVYNALQSALKAGTSFDQFKSDCRAVFERRGWTGKRAWRLDTIFRTNIQTAYNVGRYRQLLQVKDRRPYWRYSAVNDSRTRPAHRAMHGKIFPADHPFWNTWYPPNGFRCRCSVNSVSMHDLESEGWTVESVDPTGKLFEPTDPVTGVKLPARPLMPDGGWRFNPGKVTWGGFEPAQGAYKDLPGLLTAQDYGRRSLSNIRAKDIPDITTQPLPGKQPDDFYKSEFTRLYGDGVVISDPIKTPVILTLRSFQVVKESGGAEVWKFDKPGHGESIPLLREMIESPLEIWLVPQESAYGRIRLSKRYISLWKDDAGRIGGLAVFEVADGVLQGVTSFLPLTKGVADLAYLDKQRRGILLYKR